MLSGTLYGCLIHLRIYPVIYLLGILNYLFVNYNTRESVVKFADDEEGYGVSYNNDNVDNDDNYNNNENNSNNDDNNNNNNNDNDNESDSDLDKNKYENDNYVKRKRNGEVNKSRVKHQDENENENENENEKLLSMNIHERRSDNDGNSYDNQVYGTINSINVSFPGRYYNIIEKLKNISVFLTSSFFSFFLFSWFSYLACGYNYLEHAILYHLTRTDHRHNFSPLFYG